MLEVVLALGTWLGLRRARVASQRWFVRLALWLVVAAGIATAAPAMSIVPEVLAGNPTVNPALALAFLLMSALLLLAVWIWLAGRLRRSAAEAPFAAAAAVGGLAAALPVYSAAFGGDVDAQNGIMLFIVGVRQIVVVAVLAIMCALWRDRRTVPAPEPSSTNG
jgi:hypothetical protein